MADTAVMTLRLLTPAGTSAEAACDSVQLAIPDGTDGYGGGLVGILRDHEPAVMALAKGTVRASLGGKEVFRADVERGFASVRDNVVTIITDSAVVETM